jgi:hypothetical protein
MKKLQRTAPVWIAVVLGITAASWACSTPVYRYAMYRWQRAPYEVFYLHKGETPAKDAAVNKALAALSPDGPAKGKTANVRFTSLDVSDKAVLAALPPELLDTLKKHKDRPLPWHVVYTPSWTELHVGRLDENAAKTLIDSPSRKKMHKSLAGGAPCVLVLVPGKDEALNASARKHIATTIKNAAQGKFTPPADPLDEPLGQPPAGPKPEGVKAKPKLPSVATMTVNRDDPQEQWLIRCLMQAEGDLRQFSDDTMVFAVYGRARVMPPCIGKGITPENLGDYVVFSMGPCSCEVKDQNPGMDLLSNYDWQKSATALAELFGNETGNEALLQTDEFLQLLVTPPSNIGPSKDTKPKNKGGAVRPKPTGIQPSKPRTSDSGTVVPAVGTLDVGTQYAEASGTEPLVKGGPTPSAPRQDDGSGVSVPAWQVLRNLAIASAASVATLLVVGFLFLRPRTA